MQSQRLKSQGGWSRETVYEEWYPGVSGATESGLWAWLLISVEWVQHHRRGVSPHLSRGCGMTWIWDGLGHRPENRWTHRTSLTQLVLYMAMGCEEKRASLRCLHYLRASWHSSWTAVAETLWGPLWLLPLSTSLGASQSPSLSYTNLLHLQEVTLASFPTPHPP